MRYRRTGDVFFVPQNTTGEIVFANVLRGDRLDNVPRPRTDLPA